MVKRSLIIFFILILTMSFVSASWLSELFKGNLADISTSTVAAGIYTKIGTEWNQFTISCGQGKKIQIRTVDYCSSKNSNKCNICPGLNPVCDSKQSCVFWPTNDNCNGIPKDPQYGVTKKLTVTYDCISTGFIPTPTPQPTCTNECTNGTRRCPLSNTYQVCGNYDNDLCYEWSSSFNCGSGQICESGYCLTPTSQPSPTPQPTSQPGTYTRTGYENNYLNINCDSGKRIQIKTVRYGKGNRNNQCPNVRNCDNTLSCSMLMNNNNCGGDPAFGVNKDWTVTYNCVGICSGTVPTGNGIIKGPSVYYPSIYGDVILPWTYAEDATISTPCKWKCSTGYTKVGDGCQSTTTPVCTDSDGGWNLYQVGSVSMPGLGVVCSDRCSTPQELANSGGRDSLFECFCGNKVSSGGGQGSEWVYCPNGCEDGVCIQTRTCNGCLGNDDACYAVGHRLSNTYCNTDKQWVAQKQNNQNCQQNYECVSNQCINNKCVSAQLVTQIQDCLNRLTNAQKIACVLALFS